MNTKDQSPKDEQHGHLDQHGQADGQEFSAQYGGMGGGGGEQAGQGAFLILPQDGLRREAPVKKA